MIGKKAQGLQLNTLILIILGIVILVFLIIGFTMGWNKILPWLPTNNVQEVKTNCALACSMENEYDFCTKTVKVVTEDDDFTGTCKSFATNPAHSGYGIEDCPTLCPGMAFQGPTP